MKKVEKLIGKGNAWFYLVFRLLVGLLFFMHGWMKFSGEQAPVGMFLAAGIIELVVGAGVFLGAFTRGLALIGAVEMLVAFFTAHVSQGWNPLANKGEPAVLFFAAFLVLAVYGAQKWSLERALLKKESL